MSEPSGTAAPGPAGAPSWGPVPADGGPVDPYPGEHWPPARPARWVGMRDARDDLRVALVVVGTLTVAGGAAGVLWWALAPRADFTVVDGGVAPVGNVSNELLVSDDGVYVLVLAGLGLLAGVAVWALRRHRGVPALLALAGGMLAASGVAWQVGEILGRGPAAGRLADVGATVTSSLTLGALAALAVGPLVAVLVYVIAAVFVPDDEIGRPDTHPTVAVAPPPSWGSGLDSDPR